MKHKKISIKWKVFLYLLGFTVVLLLILWLFQICYLDAFYKRIKTREAREAMEEAQKLLDVGFLEAQEEIDRLAKEYNLSVLIADEEGNILYNAQYIPDFYPDLIPKQDLLSYIAAAEEAGGSAKIEFEGSKSVALLEEGGAQPIWELKKDWEGLGPGYKKPEESVIYVSLFWQEGQRMALLVNSVLTPVDATVSTLQTQLVWISIFLFLLSLLLSLLLSRNITKSIIRMNGAARELAKGDYNVEFQGNDYREIAELADTLNYATGELRKTESLRRELIANVSHDLRTPLTMIIAYAEGMRDLPGENTPENIQVVIDEAGRLANLVNDMLDISKLQAGVVKMDISVYNITGSIEKVLERYNKLVEQEGYSILFSYDREVLVKADEFKIFQVIYNLINNAIHYTGADKKVAVRQITAGDTVRIEVEDSGEGISREELPYVWERYYKVDKTHKRAVAGTGLGLAIVKNILTLHQAAYGINSRPGQGSIFWFELNCGE